jgi:hypothetical protein
VPDFFIAGHSKSGTTSMYKMLRAHPQIYMPEIKEPVFFAAELSREGHRRRLPATLPEYLALFAAARPDQRTGEASASYLRSPTAAARIAQLRPDAKIVAILREPASFLRSFHLQCVQSHYETERDLRTALDLERDRREGRKIPLRSRGPRELIYSEHVRYVEQLRSFHAQFPREQVLVLIYDDFRADNAGTIHRVLRFLEVDATVPVQPTEANPTIRMRSQSVDSLIDAVSMGRGRVGVGVKTMVKPLLPRAARQRALRATRRRFVSADPYPPDEELMGELRRRFKGEVVALSEYLDRDLVGLWGYDRID